MVEIVVENDLSGRSHQSITVSGHAGFQASEPGGDIVCAAVSALVGYLGIAATEVLPGTAKVQVEDGFFQLDVESKQGPSSEMRALIETFVRAAKQLEENYQGWVKVEERTCSRESS